MATDTPSQPPPQAVPVSRLMTFNPTKEEFKDFNRYIAYMESQGAHKAGMAKVIPPKDWKPRRTYDDIDDLVIPAPIQQVVTGQSGLFTQYNIQKKPMTVREFRKTANTDKFCNPRYVDFEELERKFWKNLTFNPPLYGADVNGTLYDPDVLEWNIGRLNTILDTVERESGIKIKGVNTPYLYFGMWKSTFAWHTEDMDLYSINYLHFGEPKSWYVVPPEHGKRLERLAKGFFPGSAQSCEAFLRHKMTLISPSILKKYGIPFEKVTQEAGEFIVTFPFAYHAGFNHGFNCAESTNFATERWIDYGKVATLCSCRKDMVKISMDVFVRKFQPDRYKLWKAGKDNIPIDHSKPTPEAAGFLKEVKVETGEPEKEGPSMTVENTASTAPEEKSPKPQIGTKRQHEGAETKEDGSSQPADGEGQAEQKKAKLIKAESSSKGTTQTEKEPLLKPKPEPEENSEENSKTSPLKSSPVKTSSMKTSTVKSEKSSPMKTSLEKSPPLKSSPEKNSSEKSSMVKSSPVKTSLEKSSLAKSSPVKTSLLKTKLEKSSTVKSKPTKAGSEKSNAVKLEKSSPVKSSQVKSSTAKTSLEKPGAVKSSAVKSSPLKTGSEKSSPVKASTVKPAAVTSSSSPKTSRSAKKTKAGLNSSEKKHPPAEPTPPKQPQEQEQGESSEQAGPSDDCKPEHGAHSSSPAEPHRLFQRTLSPADVLHVHSYAKGDYGEGEAPPSKEEEMKSESSSSDSEDQDDSQGTEEEAEREGVPIVSDLGKLPRHHPLMKDGMSDEELQEPEPTEEDGLEGEVWAKPLAHLWQTRPHNLKREKDYNRRAGLQAPYCSVCMLFQTYQRTEFGDNIEPPPAVSGGRMRTKPVIPEMCFVTTTEEGSGEPGPTPHLEEDGTSLLISCSHCHVRVHTSCYGVDPASVTKDWKCARCKANAMTESCCLCSLRGGALQKANNDKWVHVLCAVAIQEARFVNNTERSPVDLSRIPIQRFKLKCFYCKKRMKKTSGCCVQCSHGRCSTAYHPTCAQAAGVLMQPDEWPSVVYVTCCRHKGPVQTERNKAAMHELTVGQKVICKHKNGRYYQCDVVQLSKETFYEVNFDDGSFSDNLFPEDIVSRDCAQLGPPPQGEVVQVRWTDGQVYGGKFVAAHFIQMYLMEFEDGSQLTAKRDDVYALDEELPKRVKSRLSKASDMRFEGVFEEEKIIKDSKRQRVINSRYRGDYIEPVIYRAIME